MRRPVKAMSEAVEIHRKQTAGTTPEGWLRVGAARRARIERVSDVAGMNETVQHELAQRVTHHAFVELRDGQEITDYTAAHGSRMLYSETTGAQYTILRAVTWGEQLGAGRYRYGRVSLSYTTTDILGKGTG